MKIALQLYGHARSFKTCSKFLSKYLLKDNMPDIYIHTWEDIESSDSWWSPKRNPKKINKNDVIMAYRPTSLLIEKYRDNEQQEGYFGSSKVSFSAIRNMLYSQKKVNNLRSSYSSKNGFEYDLVITTRPDILLLRKLKHRFFVQASQALCDADLLLCPLDCSMIKSDFLFSSLYSALDCFYISKPWILEKMFSDEEIFKYFQHYSCEHQECRKPELAYIAYFDELKMRYRITNVDYCIYRLGHKIGPKQNMSKFIPMRLAKRLFIKFWQCLTLAIFTFAMKFKDIFT